MHINDLLVKLLSPSLPDDKKQDFYEIKNQRLFISFQYITFTVLGFFTLMNYINGKILCGHIDSIGLLIFLVSMAHYKKFGNYNFSVNLYVMGCIFVMCTQHAIAPRGLSTNLLWFPLIIVISFHMTGKKYGVFVSSSAMTGSILAETYAAFSEKIYDPFTNTQIYQYNLASIFFSLIVGCFVGRRITTEINQFHLKMEEQMTAILKEKESTSALLSIVCHDIANPLTTIKLQSSKAMKKMQQEDFLVLDQVKSIQKNVDHTIEIILNLKDMMALQKGKIQIKLSPVDLLQAIESSLKQFEEKYLEKGIKVSINNLTKMEQVFVYSEPVSLSTSVISNLITNAIKFAPENGGRIGIELEIVNHSIKFSITDNGIGIPSDLIGHLFSGTKPTSRTGTKGEKGTGFGLPILKMFMERYEGDVKVFSSTDEGQSGTTFELYFKMASSCEIKS